MSCERWSMQLALYIAGDLPAGKARAVADHLAGCAFCRREAQLLEQCRHDLAALGELPVEQEVLATISDKVMAEIRAAAAPSIKITGRFQVGPWARRKSRWLLAAAALLGILGLTVLVSRSRFPWFTENRQTTFTQPHGNATSPPEAHQTGAQLVSQAQRQAENSIENKGMTNRDLIPRQAFNHVQRKNQPATPSLTRGSFFLMVYSSSPATRAPESESSLDLAGLLAALGQKQSDDLSSKPARPELDPANPPSLLMRLATTDSLVDLYWVLDSEVKGE